MGSDAARMFSIMKNPRFPALSFFSALLIGIGWTLIAIGILVLAFCAISLFSSSAADFGAVLTTAMTFGLVGLALVLIGLFTVTGGESVRVFLAIEANTHAWTAVVKRPE
jgi:tellurite resistance protein TehA-like permease